MNINLTPEQQRDFIRLIQHDFDMTYETAASSFNRQNLKDAIWALDRLDTLMSVLESLGIDEGDYYSFNDVDKLVSSHNLDIIMKSHIYDRYDFSDT